MVQHAAADSFPRRSPEYSEVALPLHVSQVFTYRLPEPLRAVAQAGARVVVPVGRKLSTGFIVSLTNSLPGLDLKREDIKDVQELVDVIPIISPEVLKISCWIARYYAAPLGEVLKAALPPGISDTFAPVLSLTAAGWTAVNDAPPDGSISGNMARLLRLLAAEPELPFRAAASGFAPATSSTVREL